MCEFQLGGSRGEPFSCGISVEYFCSHITAHLTLGAVIRKGERAEPEKKEGFGERFGLRQMTRLYAVRSNEARTFITFKYRALAHCAL